MQIFYNNYCIKANIQGVSKDYGLYLINNIILRRSYSSSYYPIETPLFSLKEIYNTIKEVK